MNFNVKLALWFTVASTIGRNVWAFVTLTVYLKDLTGSTVNVGVAEGIQGGLQAAAAIGAGLIADRWGRDIALKIGGIFGILSIAVTVFALLAPASWLEPSGNKTGFGEIAVVEWAGVEPLAEMTSENSGDMLQTSRYTAIAIALGLWGMYQGIWNVSAQQNGGVETIFADSIATGERSHFNVRKFQLMQIASVVGPAIALVLFYVEGDTWYHKTLTDVFMTGVALCLPGALMLFFFDDSEALGSESESHAGPIRATSATVHEEGMPHKREGLCGLSPKNIPHILLGSDIISGLASGMTIKFFPLYFAKVIWLTPTETQAVYVALPFFMAMASHVAQRVAKRYGRVYTSVVMMLVASSALSAMWAIEKYSGWGCYDWCPGRCRENGMSSGVVIANATVRKERCDLVVNGTQSCQYTTGVDWTCRPRDCGMNRHWYLLIGLYYVSTLQHCCRPLKKAILMDYVSKSSRAKWNSLDSVTRFGWSGSAVAGGYIVHKWGYGVSFLATGLSTVVSASVLLLLPPLMIGGDTERERAVSITSIGSSSKASPKPFRQTLRADRTSLNRRLVLRSMVVPSLTNVTTISSSTERRHLLIPAAQALRDSRGAVQEDPVINADS